MNKILILKTIGKIKWKVVVIQSTSADEGIVSMVIVFNYYFQYFRRLFFWWNL